MDRLADNLQRLTEDDLLHVVQLVHENKTADSYTKNDVDGMLSEEVTRKSYADYHQLVNSM